MTRTSTLLLVAVVGIGVGAAACGSDEAASIAATDLDGTTWEATSVDGYELAGTLRIAFADGSLSVTGGCNTQNGAFAIDDGVLSAGPLASTMMACDDPLMAQDTWIAGLLDTGLDASLDDDTLTLADDDVTITLSAAG